eukprot:CAMPEP_0195642486 /NCGR_PEP_ID=MMETSP0815-20121206/27304_1 /TAXON_ID=97485 /ORGANISM="Prymnesium parvum, Strain Texoma1" /LENGTH=44 /DNA_ID= /DNA_START= /DNA_END= /DNA_ORIENTATION=
MSPLFRSQCHATLAADALELNLRQVFDRSSSDACPLKAEDGGAA